MSEKDHLFAESLGDSRAFAFDDAVSRVFGDMISRSVPGYGLTLEMIGVLTKFFAPPAARCYDLGCSLGAASLQMRRHLPDRQSRVIAVDNSSAMIEKLRHNIARDQSDVPVEVRLADIRDVEIWQADIVVMNFTLQFIPLAERPALLHKIHAGMNPGAVLLLSEKIRFEHPDEDQLQADMHEAFKKNRGYSELEVAQKRAALENVLIRDSLPVQQQRLRAAGFARVVTWFQCFNFFSLLAIKSR